jgi:hypothetical protein
MFNLRLLFYYDGIVADRGEFDGSFWSWAARKSARSGRSCSAKCRNTSEVAETVFGLGIRSHARDITLQTL